MRVTQGTFSYLPDFSDEEIAAQVRYAMDQDWALAVEFTDDAHPRNVYWEMWGQPVFDEDDPAAVVAAVVEGQRSESLALTQLILLYHVIQQNSMVSERVGFDR